jgi:hypothetical protein
MTLMAVGSLLPHVGKTFIESLALMARTRELTEGPVPTALRIEGGLPDLLADDVLPDNVTPFPSDRNEQAPTQAHKQSGKLIDRE